MDNFLYNKLEKPDPNRWIILSNDIIQGLSKIEKAIKNKNKTRYEGGFKLLFEKIQVLFDISGMEVNISPILENVQLRSQQRDFIRNIIKLVIACRVLSTNWEASGIHESALLVCKEVRDSLRELMRARKLVEREIRAKAREALIRSRKGGPAEKEAKKPNKNSNSREVSDGGSVSSFQGRKYALPKLDKQDDGPGLKRGDSSSETSRTSRSNSERNENLEANIGSNQSFKQIEVTSQPLTPHSVTSQLKGASAPLTPVSVKSISLSMHGSQAENKGVYKDADNTTDGSVGSQYSDSEYSEQTSNSEDTDATTEIFHH
ncbi:hypothetical protein DSO57_1005430 [Entomophthora muscae]|uniref:Uncharacterized protein n=1 Tax=Entomophthora muscae TaxID=34485 RepID=A0ACC2TWK6_9FUNG|nr:hypothetical protein DSO57_1005430 [Entomophthora muscae]